MWIACHLRRQRSSQKKLGAVGRTADAVIHKDFYFISVRACQSALLLNAAFEFIERIGIGLVKVGKHFFTLDALCLLPSQSSASSVERRARESTRESVFAAIRRR